MSLYRFFRYYFVYIIDSICFNFRYLPFRVAIKLPILLSNVKLSKMKGSISIDSSKIKFGMILIGDHRSDVFPRQHTVYKNQGGKIIFRGPCIIGSGSTIIVFSKACLILGDDFRASSQLSIVCTHYIEFKNSVRVGWRNIFIDSSFHRLKDREGNWKKGKSFAPVIIGRNNWFGLYCTIYKGTKTPDYCVIGGNSVLNKDYASFPSYILLAGNPLTIKAYDVWRDPLDDIVEYEYFDK